MSISITFQLIKDQGVDHTNMTLEYLDSIFYSKDNSFTFYKSHDILDFLVNHKYRDRLKNGKYPFDLPVQTKLFFGENRINLKKFDYDGIAHILNATHIQDIYSYFQSVESQTYPNLELVNQCGIYPYDHIWTQELLNPFINDLEEVKNILKVAKEESYLTLITIH
ncbi:MAG: hypothetical protein H7230_00700 [Candidatus Parcubacteria bacterium]|nr:hypothetical protein [Candidatus Paceibacterota bacterium]